MEDSTSKEVDDPRETPQMDQKAVSRQRKAMVEELTSEGKHVPKNVSWERLRKMYKDQFHRDPPIVAAPTRTPKPTTKEMNDRLVKLQIIKKPVKAAEAQDLSHDYGLWTFDDNRQMLRKRLKELKIKHDLGTKMEDLKSLLPEGIQKEVTSVVKCGLHRAFVGNDRKREMAWNEFIGMIDPMVSTISILLRNATMVLAFHVRESLECTATHSRPLHRERHLLEERPSDEGG